MTDYYPNPYNIEVLPEEPKEQLATWAILELMGHRRLAGHVSEVEVAGHGMLRIDVPGGATQFYSPGAVYCLTPTTEEIARKLAARLKPEPAARWELEAPSSTGAYQDDDAAAWAGE